MRTFSNLALLATLFLLVSGIPQRSVAQSGWEMVYSSPSQYIEEIFFVPGANDDWLTGWFIEQSGNVVKTTDGGETWTTYSTLPYNSISGICFINETTGWICTYNGKILKSTNGGQTWTLNASPGTWFSAIKFSDPQHGVVVGTPCIYTSDGGTTWQNATGGMQYNNMSYGSGTTFWACEMWTGKVAKSTDNGHSWSTVKTIPLMLASIDFFDADHGLSGGSNISCQLTDDGGITWTPKTLGSGAGDFLSADYLNTQTIWAGTSSGIFQSTNAGFTWNLDTTISGVAHRALFITQTNTVYVAGDVMLNMTGQIWRKIMPPPVSAGFMADDTTVCPGASVIFTNQSSPGATSFQWTFEGGTPATSTEVNPTVFYTSAGDFDVTLEASGAGGTATSHKPEYVHVMQSPEPVISGDAFVCRWETQSYETVDQPGDSYDWSVTGGTIISGTGTSLISVAWGAPGMGTVILTEINPDGCQTTTDPFEVTIDECTAIQEAAGTPALSIFPNPAAEDLNLLTTTGGEVSIYTLQGRLVLSMEIQQGKQRMNLAHLPSGIYLVRLRTEGGVNMAKLVKQ